MTIPSAVQPTKFFGYDELVRAASFAKSLVRVQDAEAVITGVFALSLLGDPHMVPSLEIVVSKSLPNTSNLDGVPIAFAAPQAKSIKAHRAVFLHTRQYDGIDLPVIAPEMLVVMKMTSPREGLNNLQLGFLATSGVLDLKKTRDMLIKYLGVYSADRWEHIRELAIWTAEREARIANGKPRTWE